MRRHLPAQVAIAAAALPWCAAACGRASETVGAIDAPGVPGAADASTATPDATREGDSPSAMPLVAEWNCGATCYRAPEVSANPSPTTRFGGPADLNATNRPKIEYPLTGALYPLNLADITFQWRRGPAATQKLFRIRLTGPPGNDDVRFEFYVPCTPPPEAPAPDECIAALPPGAWLATIGRHPGQQVTITVAAVDAKNQVATSDPIHLEVSPASLQGGFYYWSTERTFRLLFGARKAQLFISPNTSANPESCGGCHSVSLNGNRIAFTAAQTEGKLVTASTADPSKPDYISPTVNSSTVALNPEGTRALVVYQSQIVLHDAYDGEELGVVDPALLGAGHFAYQPDWAPDGNAIVVTLASAPEPMDYEVHSGSIAVLSYDAGVFGPARVVAPETAEDFNYYPTFSPDGKYIAFASAKIGPGVTSYGQLGSRLRLVARDGGKIYELTKAAPLDKGSTWPKFAPYTQSNNNIYFITFSSKIDYGFLLKNSTKAVDDPKQPQLWLAGLDVRDLGSGDPSHPPVWLPFQDIKQVNTIGTWTQRLGCPAAGESTGCADDEICDRDLSCRSQVSQP